MVMFLTRETGKPLRINATTTRRKNMNWDQVEGNWKQLAGKFREKWGKLTDSDLEVVAGKRDHLLGKLQEKYGLKREEAEKELDEHLSKW
jgi:uncharacterized protein YjbJ (UPF0337 family)